MKKSVPIEREQPDLWYPPVQMYRRDNALGCAAVRVVDWGEPEN